MDRNSTMGDALELLRRCRATLPPGEHDAIAAAGSLSALLALFSDQGKGRRLTAMQIPAAARKSARNYFISWPVGVPNIRAAQSILARALIAAYRSGKGSARR